MASKLSPSTAAAVRKYGPSINRLARRKYGIGGKKLLAKLVVGESGDNPNAVSPAGARGRTQFMPQTREALMKQYGIDPWRSADEAVHGAVVHLKGKLGHRKGLEGYNPGDPNYPAYILSQKVKVPKGGGAPPTMETGGDSRQRWGVLGSYQQTKTNFDELLLDSLTERKSNMSLFDDVKERLLSGDYETTRTKKVRGFLGPQDTYAAKRRKDGKAGAATVEGLVDELETWAGQSLGLRGTSRDRDPVSNQSVGGSSTSDHLEGGGVPRRGREAIDLPTSAAQGGWDQYRKVVRRLGLKPAENGFTTGTVRVGGRTFRVQVIFGEEHDHGDHIHVGFKRVK